MCGGPVRMNKGGISKLNRKRTLKIGESCDLTGVPADSGSNQLVVMQPTVKEEDWYIKSGRV